MIKKIFLSFAFLSLLFFGRSFFYSFVYDDHWRIEQNTAVHSLSAIPSFFTDRTTQASVPFLHQDNYRPLVMMSFAVDYFLWKDNPGPYRVTNILFHGLNAGLVCLLAMVLFGLHPVAAFCAGLFFLLHPTTAESVVWISGRSNVLSVFFILGALYAWIKRTYSVVFIFFVLGLLCREIAIVLPALLFVVDKTTKAEHREQKKIYLGLIAIAVFYLGLRWVVLGQVKQNAYWGGTPFLNLANVVAVWPLTLKNLVWPVPLQISYAGLPIQTEFFSRDVLLGTVCFSASLYGVAWAWRRKNKFALPALLFFILWLPGSNLFPLQTLFAERLLYPLLGFVGWMIGFGVHALLKQKSDKKWVVAAKGCIFGAFLSYALILVIELPRWTSDFTLWSHATKASPTSWFNWASLAQVQAKMGQTNPPLLNAAEKAYITALKNRPPAFTAGSLFMELARVNLHQGKMDEAKQHAARAISLRPDLQGSR